MFNGVPSLSCDQLPVKIADCASLFLAVDLPTTNADGPTISDKNSGIGHASFGTYSEAADRAVASLNGESVTAAEPQTTVVMAKPPRRKLCLCSKCCKLPGVGIGYWIRLRRHRMRNIVIYLTRHLYPTHRLAYVQLRGETTNIYK